MTGVSLYAWDSVNDVNIKLEADANGNLKIKLENLEQIEDTAHASGDKGIMPLAVRKGTPVNLSGDDGDYEPLQVDGGRLHVFEKNSADIKTAVEILDNAISANEMQCDIVNSPKIQDTDPDATERNNGSYAFSYDGNDRLQYIDFIISGTTWKKTLTYTSGLLTAISVWVEQ